MSWIITRGYNSNHIITRGFDWQKFWLKIVYGISSMGTPSGNSIFIENLDGLSAMFLDKIGNSNIKDYITGMSILHDFMGASFMQDKIIGISTIKDIDGNSKKMEKVVEKSSSNNKIGSSLTRKNFTGKSKTKNGIEDGN